MERHRKLGFFSGIAMTKSAFLPQRVNEDTPQSSVRHDLLTISTVTDNRVLNGRAEPLGTINDVLVDIEHGRVAYAVMASGGFMGVAERFFALPWNALRLDVERKCFMLDADKSIFENAPVFDKEHWPDNPDRQWHERIHTHYHARPYWQ